MKIYVYIYKYYIDVMQGLNIATSLIVEKLKTNLWMKTTPFLILWFSHSNSGDNILITHSFTHSNGYIDAKQRLQRDSEDIKEKCLEDHNPLHNPIH